MKYCFKCKGTGQILEQRLSEYVNSYDYYPVSCPNCQPNKTVTNIDNIVHNR